MGVTCVPRAAWGPESGAALQGTALGSGVWGLGCAMGTAPAGAGMDAGMFLALLLLGCGESRMGPGLQARSWSFCPPWWPWKCTGKGVNVFVTPLLGAREWWGSHCHCAGPCRGARRGHKSCDLVPGLGAKGTEPGMGAPGTGPALRLEQRVALEAQEGMGTLWAELGRL